jgi:NAD(P)-dependent dehydrogenase (short-subunit alcohol dehydrogenase family)
MSSFAGQRFLITGASTGLGRAIAERLADEGGRLILVSRSEGMVHGLGAELAGGPHEPLPLDVADPQAWEEAIATVHGGGPLHGLVTAAGVLGPVGPIDQIDPAEFARTISINLIGTALAVHHLLPLLRESRGRVVTFSGGGGTGPLVRYDAYAASKAAIVRLTENIAADGQIEINAIAPGFVATAMHTGTLEAGPEASGEEYFQKTKDQLAAGGFPASKAADLVAFLLSPKAEGITGRLISAQWDPWREDGFQARLRDDADLGRLRRIDEQFYARFESSGGP